MKSIVCVSSEGNDTKIVVLSKEKEGIKVSKTFSMVMSGGHDFNDPVKDHSAVQSLKGLDAEFEIEGISGNASQLAEVDKNDVSFAANYFGEDELKNADFIPVVSDPVVNHHIFTGHVNNSTC